MSLFFGVLVGILLPQMSEFWKQMRFRVFYFLYLEYLEYQDSHKRKFVRQTCEAST